MNVSQLRDQIADSFSINELKNLCFDLEIEYENLPGDTRLDVARELISYCNRRNILPALVQNCQKLRPNISWQISTINFKNTIVDRPKIFQIEFPFRIEMIQIPEGEFVMGSNLVIDGAASEDELPQHLVYISEFYIAKTPVTNAQFSQFLEYTDYNILPDGWTSITQYLTSAPKNHAVSGVSWDDAYIYCRWLAETSGVPFRLPTEAEWEKAARGTDGRVYPWGNSWEPRKVNYNQVSGDGKTIIAVNKLDVGKFSPIGDSPYGCVDMASNVWEWCSDWYYEKEFERHLPQSNTSYSFAGNVVKDPSGPPQGMSRVLRGGSSLGSKGLTRCAARGRNKPWLRYKGFGFRIAFSVK